MEKLKKKNDHYLVTHVFGQRPYELLNAIFHKLNVDFYVDRVKRDVIRQFIHAEKQIHDQLQFNL